MKKNSVSILAAGLLLTISAVAQTTSPVGLWKTIDDTSGKPSALIRITDSGGELSGKIEKLFRQPNEELNPKCIKCEGDNKDKPIVGLTMLQGMKADGPDYSGGTILDPANGKVYKSKMTLIDDGKKLNVRGYIGVPLLGRTQTWIREE
ncbi:DUF2147 domain-containing protein [Glaciimonas sp. PAMC28666]|uniref:DUF2147 domain-containing protein n=1 Tax=Glaciimonas sp. PAMC28666 TaxID=2807626 RepID=UPI001963F01F|nr:DUF2147 domain-containing protein [Glaciimonas sp. PAMC28666]QRX80923.1 DUF2147 domain-containing protein [Glaciimonas sp. PAMC28666]